MSIYDVSARLGGVIAVGAVYESKQDEPANCNLATRIRPAATLLLFDFRGHLVSAFSMPPSREIRRLVVDEESTVWTLAGDGDVKDPSVTPMLVEYGTDGTVKKELLSRSQFPLHADHIVENPATGSAEMGYSEGVLWFWLPGSTDLVTVSEPTGGIDMVKTGLPRRTSN